MNVPALRSNGQAQSDIGEQAWDYVWAALLGQQIRLRPDTILQLYGIHHVMMHDLPWTETPAQYGKHNSIYQRCRRWAKSGKLDVVLREWVKSGLTDEWPPVSDRYGSRLRDNYGVPLPGAYHILLLAQAQRYRKGPAWIHKQPVRDAILQ